MLITNGNERLTVPAEAGGGLLSEMGRTLNGICLVPASPVYPGDHPLWASFPCWARAFFYFQSPWPFFTDLSRWKWWNWSLRCPSDLECSQLGHGSRKSVVQGGRAGWRGRPKVATVSKQPGCQWIFFFPLCRLKKMQTTGALLISPALVSCGSWVLCSTRCGSHSCLMNELRGACILMMLLL